MFCGVFILNNGFPNPSMKDFFLTFWSCQTSMLKRPVKRYWVKKNWFIKRYLWNHSIYVSFKKMFTTLCILSEKSIKLTMLKFPMLTLKFNQKQPSRDVHIKRISENMQQVYERKPMPKCDFNNVALWLYWDRTSARVFCCQFAAHFQKTFS